jgi:hypothetical protein
MRGLQAKTVEMEIHPSILGIRIIFVESFHSLCAEVVESLELQAQPQHLASLETVPEEGDLEATYVPLRYQVSFIIIIIIKIIIYYNIYTVRTGRRGGDGTNDFNGFGQPGCR